MGAAEVVGVAEVVTGLVVVVDTVVVVVGGMVLVGVVVVVDGGVLTTEEVNALLVVAAGFEEVTGVVEAAGAGLVVADLLPQPMNNEERATRVREIPISFFKFSSFFPAVFRVFIPE